MHLNYFWFPQTFTKIWNYVLWGQIAFFCRIKLFASNSLASESFDLGTDSKSLYYIFPPQNDFYQSVLTYYTFLLDIVLFPILLYCSNRQLTGAESAFSALRNFLSPLLNWIFLHGCPDFFLQSICRWIVHNCCDPIKQLLTTPTYHAFFTKKR
jgi:hypothetical protein